MERHTISRRGVLAGAALAATAAGAATSSVLGGPDAPAAGAAPAPHLPPLHEAQFVPLVGKSFGVRGGRVATSVTLASVTSLAMTGLPRNTNPKIKTTGQQFSLGFTGPAWTSFPQGIYTLSAPKLGSFPLLLVPISQPSGIQEYQAIIVSV